MKNKQDSFKQQIEELKDAAKNKLFLEDVAEISKDFKTVDLGRKRGINNE